jgi:hypothetical protein
VKPRGAFDSPARPHPRALVYATSKPAPLISPVFGQLKDSHVQHNGNLLMFQKRDLDVSCRPAGMIPNGSRARLFAHELGAELFDPLDGFHGLFMPPD